VTGPAALAAGTIPRYQAVPLVPWASGVRDQTYYDHHHWPRACASEITGQWRSCLQPDPAQITKAPTRGRAFGGLPGPGSLGGLVKRYPCIDWPIRVGRTFTRCSRGDQNELVRVVVTRIGCDGTMQRRMVDTAQRTGGLCRARTRSWA